ncbi:MAG TPA: TolC family protein [Rhodanobacteraceae bacterium]|nr:TolC family protein [Rhodanobacteraceae bacterium]
MRFVTRLGLAGAAAVVAGCAAFHALPLDRGRAPARAADITVAAATMPTPTLRAHTFDPADGLDVTEVAMLAIANNPQLRVERDKAGVAHAQAYAAGLLPDPNVAYEHDRPVGNAPGANDAFSASLSLDLGNLVTRSARVASARAGVREVDLNLLWSEWQTIAQARTLFDRIYFARERVARLQVEHAALAPVQAAIIRALDSGRLNYPTAGAGLNAAANTTHELGIAEHDLNVAERDLHDLLGLDEAAPLRLTGAPFSVEPDPAGVQRALAEMPHRRPDLLALQAGYASQQQKLRSAILAQFPAITVGFVRARDNSNITSRGFSIGLSLPLFDGNRGNIAIARATRLQLRDAYTARLLVDRNDVQKLWADLQNDRARHGAVADHAARLDRARKAAQADYAGGRLDWPTYLEIRASSLAADTSLLTLEQDTHATAIALDALTGGWPPASAAEKPETQVRR